MKPNTKSISNPTMVTAWPPSFQTSLTRQTFLVIGLPTGAEFDARGVGGVVRFHSAGEPGALDRLRAEIVERLDPLLPRLEVEHQQVPLVDVGRDVEVEALRLVDERGAIGREF